MKEEYRMIDVGDLNAHIEDDIRVGAFMEREPTSEERRILESRYVEVEGSPEHHQGLWFLGKITDLDTQTGTFEINCYRCGHHHYQIDPKHITLVRRQENT
jgi:hypothetical protein